MGYGTLQVDIFFCFYYLRVPASQCPVLACCFTDKKRQVTAYSEHYYAGKSWRAISMSKTVRFKLLCIIHMF